MWTNRFYSYVGPMYQYRAWFNDYGSWSGNDGQSPHLGDMMRSAILYAEIFTNIVTCHLPFNLRLDARGILAPRCILPLSTRSLHSSRPFDVL